VKAERNSEGKAVAEVDLRITDRCSGDNYKVYASLLPIDQPNPWRAQQSTGTLVAWKACLVEYDRMYKEGGDIASIKTTRELPEPAVASL